MADSNYGRWRHDIALIHGTKPRVFNRRSRTRFAANRTAELVRHIGPEPSHPERVIARLIALEFELYKIRRQGSTPAGGG